MTPFYEYRCPKCNEVTELLQPVDAQMFTDCPCGGIAERKMSTFSITPIFRRLESKSIGYKNLPDPELKRTVHKGIDIP